MKKFELRMGIVMLLVTTILDVLLLLTVELDLINVFIIVGISGLGFGASNLYLDSYLYRYKIYYYDKGVDAGKTSTETDDYDKVF